MGDVIYLTDEEWNSLEENSHRPRSGLYEPADVEDEDDLRSAKPIVMVYAAILVPALIAWLLTH